MPSDVRIRVARRVNVVVFTTIVLLPAVAFAQSPWERAASNLEGTFTGPLARSLALVAIVIGGLMFMFGEGGREAPDLRHRLRRRTGALRRAVPRLVVLTRPTVLRRSARMPDRPTYRPVYKALHRPLTVCGVDRRLFFLALLLGRGHVQPVLLLPRRPADVRRPLRLCAVGDGDATRRCCGFCSLRRRLADATTRPNTIASTWRSRHGEAWPHPPRLPGGRQRQQPARALGIRR